MLVLLPLLWTEGIWAADCGATNYNLNSQSEVDALGATGCDRILGYLRVASGSGITTLDGLASITSIGGDLLIYSEVLTNVDGLASVTGVGGIISIVDNTALTNIDGLSSIASVGEFLTIQGNNALTNVDGLANLSALGGGLVIFGNAALTNIDGLANLTYVSGALQIKDNAKLIDVDGLANITGVGRFLLIENNSALLNLDGLISITSVEEYLEVDNNDALTNVDGLANLSRVGGSLQVSNNFALTNVDGFGSLTGIGYWLWLYGNYNLSNCQGLAPVLGWPSGPPDDGVEDVIVFNSTNGVGCRSISDVLASVSGPTAAVITEATSSGGLISITLTPSTTSDTAFPVTGYAARCLGSDVDVSGAPVTDLFDNLPVEETLTVSGYDPTSVPSSVEVDIDITHSDPTDLYVTLTTPEGTELILWNQGSSSGEDLVGTFPTTLTPADNIAVISSEPMDGDWVLSVEDVDVGPIVREGVLKSWGIRIVEEVTASGSASPIEVRGLTGDRTYNCTVAPVTKLGTGPVSGPYTVSVPLTLPAAPIITSTDFEDGKIILTVSISSNGGAEVTGYDASCTDGTSTYTATSTSASITVSGLTNDVAYVCTVTATNAVGTGAASEATAPITPEGPIQGLPIWLLYQISGQSGGNDDGVNTYTVTASAGTGGSISPSGAQTVNEGGTISFTLTASSGYSVSGVSGTCPSGSLSGTIYTTGAITQSCTVVANFYAINESGYCSDTPAGVICDPNSNGRTSPGGTMDSWSEITWGFENTPIPNGKVVAYPFLANAGAGNGEGIMEFSNNMPDLTASGYTWKGWFSETPGGAVMNNNASYCRKYSANPNPQQMRWSQSSDPNRFACNLGQAERVLYFNMEIGCYEEVWATVPLDQRDCTVGVPFPGVGGYPSYYINVYPR